jgi:hypothetical protein
MRRSRKKEKFAIGQNAIHVEQDEFDFLGAGLRVRHGRIVTKAAFSR